MLGLRDVIPVKRWLFWAGSEGHGTSLGPFFIKSNIYENGYQNDILPHLIEIFANQVDLKNGEFLRLWWTQDRAPAHRLRQPIMLYQFYFNA